MLGQTPTRLLIGLSLCQSIWNQISLQLPSALTYNKKWSSRKSHSWVLEARSNSLKSKATTTKTYESQIRTLYWRKATKISLNSHWQVPVFEIHLISIESRCGPSRSSYLWLMVVTRRPLQTSLRIGPATPLLLNMWSLQSIWHLWRKLRLTQGCRT